MAVLASLLIIAQTLVVASPFADDPEPETPTDTTQDAGQDAPEVVVALPTPAYINPVWDTLAYCESRGLWHINTGNGYYGGLQEDLPFWRRHGGLQYASRPDLASREAQISVARTGLAVQGWAAWPACSRRLGLR
jgi:hypothetical protein